MRALPPGIQEALDTRTAFTPLVIVEASRLGESPQRFKASSGRVTFDNRRTVFGDGEVVLTLPAESPVITSHSILTPFGTRISIDLGITLPSGASGSVPAGRFVVDASTSDVVDTELGARIVTLKLVDLSKVVSDYRFERPFRTAAGDMAAVINAVVANRTGSNPGLANTGVSIGPRVFGLEPESDPWKEISELAIGFGFYLFYGRDGNLNLTQPNHSGAPRPISPLSLRSSFDRRPANVVVARGESTDEAIPPVQAVAVDDDPSSPTYAGTGPGSSPYGRITRYFASPLLTTVAQAQSAAESILERELVVAATWTLDRAWDPTVEPYDVLAVGGAAPQPIVARSQAMRTGPSSGFAETADAAKFTIPDNLDVRARVTLDNWQVQWLNPEETQGVIQTFVSKRQGGDEWQLRSHWARPTLAFPWWDLSGDPQDFVPDEDHGFADGTTHWCRATKVGGDLTFYVSDDDTDDHTLVSWTQLGSVIAVPSGPIRDAATAITIGANHTGVDNEPLTGFIHAAAILDGSIVVADPVFADPREWVIGDDSGDTRTDDEGNDWTLAGSAFIAEREVPVGFVSSPETQPLVLGVDAVTVNIGGTTGMEVREL